MKKRLIAASADLLTAVLLLGGIYGANYLLPQKGVMAQDMSKISANSESSISDSHADFPQQSEVSSVIQGKQAGSKETETKLQNLIDNNAGWLQTTKVKLDPQDWHQKFADKFTDQIVSTDTSYTSLIRRINWIIRKMENTKNTVSIFPMFWQIFMWEILPACKPVSHRTLMV